MASNGKQNFLWIKLVKAGGGGATTQIDQDTQSAAGALEQRLQQPLLALSNTFRAVEQAVVAPPPQAPVTRPSGARPPGVFAGSAVHSGWWVFDREYSGVPEAEVRIVMHPMLGTREQAVAWLTTDPAGQAWALDALNYALLSFDQWTH